MNTCPATPFGLPDDAPDLARRFAMIMVGLGGVVARRFLRMPHLSGLTVLLFSRLHRAARRFYRALTRPPAKARAARRRGDRADAVRARGIGLPSGRGWIVRELGWEAAGYMAQLEALLAEVASQAALAAAPGAGRILRPICRMLGVSATVTPQIVPAVVADVAPPGVVHWSVPAFRVPGFVVPEFGVFSTGGK